MEIQSESGPAVARPMKVPIRRAKLKNPIHYELWINKERIWTRTNNCTTIIVWGGSKILRLCQVDRQEATGAPGDNKAGELNNGETEKLPWGEEFNPPRRVGVGRLPKSELRLGRFTFA